MQGAEVKELQDFKYVAQLGDMKKSAGRMERVEDKFWSYL